MPKNSASSCSRTLRSPTTNAGSSSLLQNPRGAALLLAEADTPEQSLAIGNQTGGRVFLFLHTDDFWREYKAYQSRGVRFLESPREESYGTVAVFEDLYGNKWDLLQPADPATRSTTSD